MQKRSLGKILTAMICRLCLEKTTKKHDIFSGDGDPPIAASINKYFHIEVQPNDVVSTIICAICWQHLYDFHVFCLNIEEKQKTLQTHLLCKEIKQDIEDTDSEECVNKGPIIDGTINAGVNELHETELDIAVEQPNTSAIGFDFEAVEIKDDDDDDVSSNKDTLLVTLTSPADNTPSEDNILELNMKTKRKYNKKTQKLTETATKRILRGKLRSAHKNEQNDCEAKMPNENKSKKSSKNNATPPGAKASRTRELDQYIAENTKLSCCLCSQPCADFKQLKQHFRQTHDCEGYVPCCGNRYNQKALYVDHLRVHKDPDYFKCTICNKQLASRFNHTNHMDTVHPDSERLRFTCKMCPRKFAQQYILEYHVKSKHTTARNYICKTCNKGFKTAHNLKVHEMGVHLDAYGSVCEICGKSLRTQHNLLNHMEKIHNTKLRPGVQCRICLKHLKNADYLKEHMNMHRDPAAAQEFKCSQCNVTKNTRPALEAHIRYHHSNKVYTCKECGKEFRQPLQLKEHETIHTGTYLYSCKYCSQTFRSQGNVYKHKVKFHPEVPIQKRSQANEVIES